MPSAAPSTVLRTMARSFSSTPFARSALTRSAPRHSVVYSAYPKRVLGSAAPTLGFLGFFFGFPVACGIACNGNM